MDTPLILGIDTATLAGSVCLARGEKVLASVIGDPKVSHSNDLLSDINRVLDDSKVSLTDVDVFAVANGPGSFTGLRIGLATVKALSKTLSRACVGIPTLRAIAHSCGPADGTVAALPAGRGEVFVQLFTVSRYLTVRELDKPAHLSPEKTLLKYNELKNLKWAGEGAQLHQTRIKEWAAQRSITFGDEPTNGASDDPIWILARREVNLASSIAALALERFRSGDVETPDSLRAIYVSPPDAEVKTQWQ